MTVSLAAGTILGVTGAVMTKVFAWVGVAAVIFVAAVYVTEIAGEAVARSLKDDSDSDSKGRTKL